MFKKLKLKEDGLIVKRALEDGYEVIKVKTPCLLTAIEELNEPRYMNITNIFDTYHDKEVKVMDMQMILDVDKLMN